MAYQVGDSVKHKSNPTIVFTISKIQEDQVVEYGALINITYLTCSFVDDSGYLRQHVFRDSEVD